MAVTAYAFDDLQRLRITPRRVLLTRGDTPILRSGQLAQVFAERGIGKTWLTRTLSLIMASGGSAIGFSAPSPSRVLYIDGEMASEDIQSRDRKLAEALRLPKTPQLVTIAADWQAEYLPRLDIEEGQLAVAAYVDAADVVVVDNRSCLFDPEGEKDPTAWQPTQEWLLSLRRMGKAVILVHHANRQGGARGIGKAEDILDLVVKLARPDDYDASHGARFELSWTKTRGIPGGADLRPFTAALGPHGWVIEAADVDTTDADQAAQALLTAIRHAYEAGEPLASKTAAVNAVRGKRKRNFDAFDRLVGDGVIERTPDGRGFRPKETAAAAA